MRSILVAIFLGYLRILARIALYLHKPTVIGITGSVGKSSERDIVYAMLKDYYKARVIEKGNSETGIPLGILGLSVTGYGMLDWFTMLLKAPIGLFYLAHTTHLVIEMGVDEPTSPKNMQYLLTIVKPTISIFLNVHPVHTQQFEKALTHEVLLDTATDPNKRLAYIKRAIAHEKGKIITTSGCRVGIYNANDLFIKREIEQVDIPATTLATFGTSDTNTVQYGTYKSQITGTFFTFYVNGENGKESLAIQIQGAILPKEYQEIIAASIAVGKSLKLTNLQISKAIQKNFTVPKGRASILQGIKDSIIIDSSYNASSTSVLAFLKMAAELKRETKRELVFLFGDMRELGEEAAHEHEAVAHEIIKCVDYLYCVGPLTKNYVLPIVENKIPTSHFQSAKEAGSYLGKNLPARAIVLVKGSQNTIYLEEAVKYMLKNENDKNRLCRQEAYWLKIKSDFFNRVSAV